MAKAKAKKAVKKAKPAEAPVLETPPTPPVDMEKEARRAKLLEFQAFCEKERITRLSDLDIKLRELDK